MLNNISWASYVFAIFIFVLIYYSFVLILYYQHDLQNVFQKIKSRFSNATINPNSFADQHSLGYAEINPVREKEENYIPELLLSLQTLIKNGAARKFPREELLLSMQLKLQQYPVLKDNTDKEKISHFIITECINYCSIHLSEEEVSALWNT